VMDRLPQDRNIYVHCRTGMRSARAVQLLQKHGFSRATNVTGGIESWLAEER